MNLELPEKRKKTGAVKSYVLQKVKFEPSIREDVCFVRAEKSRKDIMIPVSCLTEESRKIAESFKGQVVEVSSNGKKKKSSGGDKIVCVEEKKKCVVAGIRTSKRMDGKANGKVDGKDDGKDEEKEKYLFKRMKEVYSKGNHLIHKPVKIIGCHGKNSLTYSILFNSRSGYNNASTIPHSILLEKYPDLFIDFISKAGIQMHERNNI